VKNWIRNLIIGKNRYIEDYSEYRRVILCGWFSFMAVAAAASYLLVGLAISDFQLYPMVTIGAAPVVALATLALNRAGRYQAAKVALLAGLNAIIFLVASSEAPQNGVFPVFLVVAIGSFGLFGYTEKWKPMAFSLLSLGLYLLAFYVPVSILPFRHYSAAQMAFNQTLNFTVAGTAAVMVVALLTRLNHYQIRLMRQQKEALQKANHELDRFVYSTSHDLRAPLSSLMGLINITRMAKPDEIKTYLNLMEDRVRAMDQFIRDITDYSRNNRTEVQRQNVELKKLILEVWTGLKFIPGAQEIKLTIDVTDGQTISSDPARLKIIFGNLLSNAIRYHDHGKANRFIRLRAEESQHGLKIFVEDNGLGIEPEYQVKIFEMFFRASEKSKGSGLGLYIVKETVEKLDGSISVHSVPSQGSVFTLLLPQRAAA
jgi:signal transduction histidine kinase